MASGQTLTVYSLTSTPSISKPTMADDTHDATCGCLNFGSSYAPLTPDMEPNAGHMLTVQQGSEPLTLAFSDISFAVISTGSDGTGLLNARNSCFPY